MVVINMAKVGKLVAEGEYEVTLTRATEKEVKDGVLIMFITTIRGDEEWDGSTLIRNFFISTKPDADNGNTFYYLQQSLLAFGADEDDVTSESMDPVKVAGGLYGNKALAKVVHNADSKDPSKMYANVSFAPSDL